MQTKLKLYLARTLVQQCVAHWERMRDNPFGEEAPFASECSCCCYYEGCTECPIARYVGLRFCQQTPFNRAYAIWVEMQNNPDLKSEWQAAAQEEIDFLRRVEASVDKELAGLIEEMKGTA